MKIPPDGYEIYPKDIQAIKKLKVGIIGFGNQARAWAMNLLDSGIEVYAGLRQGSPNAHDALWNFVEVLEPSRVAKMCDIICPLIPDDTITSVLREIVFPGIKHGTSIVLAHSYSIYKSDLEFPPNADLMLLAPHAPGSKVRDGFLEGSGIPAQWDVIHDSSGKAEKRILALASALGFTSGGMRRVYHEQESVIDLFSEQAVLVGGLLAIIKNAYDILREAGYDLPASRVSCIDEIEGTAKLFTEKGLNGAMGDVSSVAAYGAVLASKKLDAPLKEVFTEILKDIESGEFSKRFNEEALSGYPELNEFLKSIE